MEAPISAREAQSLRTREAILDAATKLLGEKPIEAITINELVAVAGVAKGSFYNHFSEKESLANEAALHIRKQYQTNVREANRNVTDPAYQIARGMCTFVQTSIEHPKLAKVLLRGDEWITRGDHPLNEDIQRSIDEGIDKGIFLERARHAGIVIMLGTSRITNMRLLSDHPTVDEIRELTIDGNALVLCAYGVEEKVAMRISRESAQDIIRG